MQTKKNEAIINYNGNIYKCTATDFDKTERYGFLNEDGNIIGKMTNIKKD